jgi:predicted dehydrogenase
MLSFGLIGAGRIAQAYAQAFEGIELARIVAVADIESEAASTIGEWLGCRSYDSYQAMAAEVPLDAVVICTPPATHPEICLFFLQRQVHVLCEKPLSIDSRSAKAMLETARKCGVRLTMASKFRYVEDVIRAKSIIRSGLLGELTLIENVFTSRIDMSSRWNSNPEISGGGVLIDNGTHSVDLLRYLIGPIAEVQVVEGKRSQGLAVEETVHLFVRSFSGILGSVDLSWSIDKELESYLRIYGTQGTLSVGWKTSKYHQSSSKSWIEFGEGYDKINAFRSQIRNFCRAIYGKEALLVTPEDALASVEVIEAAYAALRQNRWTPVTQLISNDHEISDPCKIRSRKIA